MLTGVSISNFKSIKEIKNLKLKPLTVFAGANSSGKSNIMEAIAFFGQATRWAKTSNQTPNVKAVFRLGDIKQYPRRIEDFIVFRKDPRKKVTLEISLKADKNLMDIIATIMKVLNVEIETVGYSFSFRLADSFFSQKVLTNETSFMEVQSTRGDLPTVVHPNDMENVTLGHTLDAVLVEGVFTVAPSKRIEDSFLTVARIIVGYIKERAERIYFLSGERGTINPEVTVSQRGDESPPTWIGFGGQDLIEILSRCFTREPEKARKIQEWASKFQLPSIRAGYVGRGRLESNFKDRVLNINLNSTLAGLGSRQILSIITQIFWSESGDVIIIEEPEISLHPENQVLLHELFSEAISQGKQIICSTHSPFFVLALSKIIKKKLLALDDIAIYEVERDKEGTFVKTLELNKHGFIVSGIPSFMKVEEDLFRDWSESLEEE